MEEPVKPLTTAGKASLRAAAPGRASKKARAALAVRAILRAARLRTPSGSPSPQTSGGRMALWRSSIRSQIAWPTKWLEMAWQERPWSLSSSHFWWTYFLLVAAASTSKWSPQQASSRPS